MLSPGFEAVYEGRTSAEPMEEADGAEGEFTDPSGNVCFKSGSPAVCGASSATRLTTGACTRSSSTTRPNSARASASGWIPG